MSACSSDELEAGGNDINIKVTPGNSDVKIQLSTGSGGTRAALSSDDKTGVFEAEGLGIFCLSHALVEGAKDLQNTWLLDDKFFDYTVWLDNVLADAELDKADNSTNIVFKKENEDGTKSPTDYYYPMANWLTYGFYGYYPRQPKDSVKYGGHRIDVNVPIDGKTDIIWGEAVSGNTNAYSAKYFRDGNSELPNLGFKHELIQIKFYVKAEPKTSNDYSDVKDLVIKDIIVEDVPEFGQLHIVNRSPGALYGDIQTDYYSNKEGKTVAVPQRAIHISGVDDGEFSPTNVDNDDHSAHEVGQGLLVPALKVGGEYTVKVHLVKKDANGEEQELGSSFPPVTLTGTAANEEENISGYFTNPGTIYNVVLHVYSPEKVQLKATLKKWNEVDYLPGIDY